MEGLPRLQGHHRRRGQAAERPAKRWPEDGPDILLLCESLALRTSHLAGILTGLCSTSWMA
jgi:hypothetical protein